MVGITSMTGKQDSTMGPGMSVVVFVTVLNANVPFTFEQSYLKSTPFSQMLQLLHSVPKNSFSENK